MMLLRTLLLRLVVASPVWAAPADSLRGRVVDSAGAPIAAARVVLVELGRATLTADDGTFAFASVHTGRYTVVAHDGPAAAAGEERQGDDRAADEAAGNDGEPACEDPGGVDAGAAGETN